MECKIEECVRGTENEFCSRHQKAKNNIKKTFSKWKIAYGEEYSYMQYLTRLANDDEIGAGHWVIQVAQYLLDQEK